MEKKAGCYEYLAGGFLLLLQDTITSTFVQKHAAPWVPPLLRMNDFIWVFGPSKGNGKNLFSLKRGQM